MDFDIPEYKFSSEQFSGEKDKNGYKDILKEAFDELYRQADISEQYLAQVQQLVIDMGTLIERVKGEGTKTVNRLEQLCEDIYQLSVGDGNIDIIADIKEAKGAFELELQNNKETVFIVSKAEQWKYAQWYYLKNKAMQDVDIYIIVVPYYYKKYDGSCYDYKYELQEVRQIVKNINGTDENVIGYQQFDIALHHPETIVIQNPCDEWNNATTLQEEYYSRTLQKYTEKLVYIQSFEVEEFTANSYREWYNMKYYCTMPGVIRADEVYVQSENMREVYIEKLIDFSNIEYKEIWEEKVHKCNLLFENHITKNDKKDCHRKKIAFYVQVGSVIQYGRKMIEKLKSVLGVLQNSKDKVELIWIFDRGHEAYLKKNEERLEKRYSDLKEIMERDGIGRCIYRDEMSVSEIVDMCDAYYGSESRLALDFWMKKKPVMIMKTDIW